FYPNEAHLDPRAALKSLAEGLRKRGVEVRHDAPQPEENVVDCRGIAARGTLPGLRAVRGEMMLLHCPDLTLTRPLRLLHPRFPVYLVPRGQGLYMLGATM